MSVCFLSLFTGVELYFLCSMHVGKGTWNCHNLLMYIAIKMAAAQSMSIKLFSLFNECHRRLCVTRNYHYFFVIKTMVVALCEGWFDE